jgi:hypothetical protein
MSNEINEQEIKQNNLLNHIQDDFYYSFVRLVP